VVTPAPVVTPPYSPPGDTTPPIVTAVVQNVTNADGQTINVQSNEGTGNVFIVLSGEPQATAADFATAITAHKGASGAVVTAGGNVAVSTTSLTAGIYHAYAVDAVGNISTTGTNAITVSALNSTTSQAFTTVAGDNHVVITLTGGLPSKKKWRRRNSKHKMKVEEIVGII